MHYASSSYQLISAIFSFFSSFLRHWFVRLGCSGWQCLFVWLAWCIAAGIQYGTSQAGHSTVSNPSIPVSPCRVTIYDYILFANANLAGIVMIPARVKFPFRVYSNIMILLVCFMSYRTWREENENQPSFFPSPSVDWDSHSYYKYITYIANHSISIISTLSGLLLRFPISRRLLPKQTHRLLRRHLHRTNQLDCRTHRILRLERQTGRLDRLCTHDSRSQIGPRDDCRS